MNEYKKTDGKKLLLCCAAGVGASLLAAPVLLVVLTAVAMGTADPGRMSYLGYVALYLSCALCGFVSGKSYGKKPLPCGVLSGVMYTLCLLGVSALASDGIASPILMGICPLCSVLGAMAGTARLVSTGGKRPNRSNSNKLYKKYKR